MGIFSLNERKKNITYLAVNQETELVVNVDLYWWKENKKLWVPKMAI